MKRWSRMGGELDEGRFVDLIRRGASLNQLTAEMRCGYPRALNLWRDLHRRGLCGPAVVQSPSRRYCPIDDGEGLEEICGGNLSALARAVAYIDDRDAALPYIQSIRQRTALLRCAKHRRHLLRLPTDIPPDDLEILLPEGI